MKKMLKVWVAFSCIFIFTGCGNKNDESKSSEKSNTTSEKIVKKKPNETKTSLSTESSISESKSTIQSVEPSSNTPVEASISSDRQEESMPEQDPRIGQVLTSPHGHQCTVLRILPNGEQVIKEETSQADYNNDGLLTFEELSRAENELTQQAEGMEQHLAELDKNQVVAEQNQTVLITGTGSKYHSRECGNGTYSEISLEGAKSMGLTPCEKCY
ncbi:hypothetical protein [Enterococcus pallens]|uniref:EF-hand domain-containing protein n=1 Tax=Enterococcus pallens ATCC BAA-351 TaxID=1158607 RepID=R2PTU9_9ENTE|nr:hypothetical protein [Enterococcus pallens]EOH86743.1 hypothetical protein UAU_05189 [Enterococcus pallens ATCC BAA-351]EOU18539.1 hypothetical protein I588_03534 [Enterococcus pallens ATCC BAA-351]OJG71172.1 hypothetical protein RV10_GL005084 [Enterococcus pallens]